MDGSLHGRDFFTWTQEQAAARPNPVEELDLPNLIEEVEDLRTEQVDKVRSHLLLLLAHAPQSTAVHHQRGEVQVFRRNAVRPFRPSMRRLVEPELAREWRLACDVAADRLGQPLPAPPGACPLTLDELLDEAMPLDALLAGLTPKD